MECPTPKASSNTGNIRRLVDPLLLLLSIFSWVCCCFGAEESQPLGTFKVTVLPPELPVDQVKIECFMSGLRGPVRHLADSHDFLIPEGNAKALEAIIYCPGYDLVTISVPSLASSTHKTAVTLSRVPMIHFSGRIAPYNPVGTATPEVCIEYITFWGEVPGPSDHHVVTRFRVAVAPLFLDGSFSAELPDFTHLLGDPRFEDAGFCFRVQDAQDGRGFLQWLTPTEKPPLDILRIKASYDTPTMFSASPR
jgi:hypothetical protein